MLLTAVPTSPLCLLFLTFKSENKAVLLYTLLYCLSFLIVSVATFFWKHSRLLFPWFAFPLWFLAIWRCKASRIIRHPVFFLSMLLGLTQWLSAWGGSPSPSPGDTGQCLVVSPKEWGDASGLREPRDAAHKHLVNTQDSPVTKNFFSRMSIV